jgi:DNA polymerase-3 subunit delta'
MQAEWVARAQLPPVLLLTGLDGVGKRSLVHYLAQWILCEKNGFRPAPAEDDSTGDLFGGSSAPAEKPKPAGTRPCGECTPCRRAINGTWVDFTEIKPEDDDERGTLKVEQFRDLKAKMGFGAHEGAAKIILIPNADRMTPQASNSMLKLLEEPPRGWVFFLTASDPTLILPTVLSRCQAIRLLPMPKSVILGLLESAGVPADRREVASELAQGSWGKALKLGEDDCWEKRALLFQFLEDGPARLGNLVEWASQSPAELELLLNQLEHVLSELVLWSMSGSPPSQFAWKNRDGARQLAAHASAVTASRGGPPGARSFWIERALRLGEIRKQSLAPLNRKILAQDLMMPWLGVEASKG